MGMNPTSSGTPRALGEGVASVAVEDGVAIVRMTAGALRDHEIASILPDLLMVADDCDGRVVVSFARVHTMSSACINAVIELHRRCKEAGGRLIVCELPPELRAILGIVRLDRAVAIERTEASAKDAAARGTLRAA